MMKTQKTIIVPGPRCPFVRMTILQPTIIILNDSKRVLSHFVNFPFHLPTQNLLGCRS